MKEELKEAMTGGGKKVVAFACTRSVCQAPLEAVLKESGLDPDNLVIVNAREQLALVHQDIAGATEKAKMLLNAVITKALIIEPMETITIEEYQEAPVEANSISSSEQAGQDTLIQIVEKKVNHPEVNQDICGKCGICMTVCPYEAITIPEGEYPEFKVELCQSCGLCVSSCPTRAIEASNFGYDIIEAQVKAILNVRPEDMSVIIGFVCDHSGYSLLDAAGLSGETYSSGFIPVYVNCMSDLSLMNVANAVRKGANGVMLIGCLKDECRFMKGIERSRSQVHIINEFFKVAGVKNPIKLLESDGSTVNQFTTALVEMETQIHKSHS
ncbi:MAG: hydrogenase iron-sulfur subunit [Candidatus Bathyarchaeota archaeon]|nr:hydrogenase iron-sulfur subunit [Candidatus Bathyarchaeota archaeon]